MKLTFINKKQESTIENWLEKFTNLSNEFSNQGNKELKEYWKGQVMGMCKIIDEIKIDIDTHYWLNKIH